MAAVGEMYQKIRDIVFAGRSRLPPSSDGRRIPLRVGNGTPLTDPRSDRPYRSNSIRTTRYTLWNFLPKQILYQFSRLANFYFLCMAILQLIPGISTTGRFTVLIPLLIFVSLTIAKEGYDDLKRHRLDKVENRRHVAVLRRVAPVSSPASSTGAEMDFLTPGSSDHFFEWTTTQWQHLKVGDVIRLCRDDDVAADIVLLHAEGDVAYIETMALDGETSLKSKQAPSVLEPCSTPGQIAGCSATFVVEDPNQNLHRFEGQVIVGGRATPLSDLEVIYRGSVLRNTTSAVGMVINTGEETKIRMNANRHPQTKRPALEHFINKIVIIMVALLFTVSGLGYLGYSVWRTPSEENAWYMYSEQVPFQEIFIGFLIMFNSAVPMSLIMGLEVIKLAQMDSINRDLQLYHAPTDTPGTCNTDSIIDDLGQIGYVFTDKTGTLTENDMRLRKLNIAGTSWAHRMSTAESASSLHGGSTEDLNAARPKPAQQMVEPTTDELLECLRHSPDSAFTEKATQFLLCLATCHTAQPEVQGDKLAFQASSPDELALVQAAQELGFCAVERSAGSMTVQMSHEARGPVRRSYEILDVLEFTSNRKRMSIVLRCPDGRIVLFCKGADTVLLPRMAAAPQSSGQRSRTGDDTGHIVGIESSDSPTAKFNNLLHDERTYDEAETRRKCILYLDDYAREGLRTLLFCQRYLSEAEYRAWKARYHEAQISLVDRQERVEAVSEEIEQSLELIGASAIVDRLQDGVPETVDRLRKAGIKIWMLTGDKRETAINIARSARICGPSSTIRVLDVEKGALEAQCHEALEVVQQEKESSTHTVLVVDGNTLHAIQDDHRIQQLFHAIIPAVNSVVCCRASPSQKALLVAAIKDPKPSGGRFSWLRSSRRPLTLAIGDGANDLAMITTAHVGIGISGKEGQQAARIADFSIAQFRFLARLLLVHGRWNYHRTTRFILAAFWKELFHSVIQGIYQTFVGFTGTSLFPSLALVLYGSLFSTLAAVAIGSWEQDLKPETLMAVPQLYRYGLEGRGLNIKNFFGWVCNAFVAGLLIVCVIWAGYGGAELVKDNGLFAFSTLALALNIIWTNIKLLLLELHCKTVVILGMFAAMMAAFWLWMSIMSVASKPAITPFAVRNGLGVTFGKDPMWWISLIIGLIVLGAMELILKSLRWHRLARVFRSGVSPAKERSDLADGNVLTGYQAWYPYLWQQIEHNPNASEWLRSLLPKPEVHSAKPPVAEGKKKSRKPADTPWRQQRLWAWRPVITPKRAIQLFFALAAVILPIGVALAVVNDKVEEISIDYTDCLNSSPADSNNTFPPRETTFANIPDRYVSKHFKSHSLATTKPATWAHSFKSVAYDPAKPHNTTVCSLQFDIESRLAPPVLLHYRLTNFYQNHRDYIDSVDADQLKGVRRSAEALASSACAPLDVDPATGKPFYPCGLIANSVFNDTFSQPRRVDGAGTTYNMTTAGIALRTDRDVVGTTQYAPDDVVPPPAWRARFPDGYVDGVPDLAADEGFIVWMRTAALPTFRKLAMRDDREGMAAGRYQVDVEDNYEVSAFGGSKSLVITKQSKLGGNAESLASLCFLIGGVSLVLGVFFTVTGLVKRRKITSFTLLQ